MNLPILLLLLAQTSGETTLSGRVTDSVTHQPIAGARVVYEGDFTDSDANGAWVLHPKPNNRGQPITIRRHGYITIDAFNSYEAPLVMTPGESETRNFELTPVARMTGHLIDRDSGKSLAGFYVIAHQGSFRTQPDPKGTGADGSFDIEDLVPGAYSLEIEPPISSIQITAPDAGKDAEPDEPGYGPSWFPGVPRVEMAAPISLAPGEKRDIEVRLQKREGRHVTGLVQATQGRESERVSIRLTGPGCAPAMADLPKAGPFRIDGLDQGSYQVAASFLINNKTPARERAFAVRAIEITDHDIDDLKLVLQPGVSVRTTVTMAEGEKEGKASVPLTSTGMVLIGPGFGGRISEGFYQEGLPPGEYTPMLILPPGYSLASVNFNGHPVFNTRIDIEAPESVLNFVVTSRPAGLIATVHDSEQKPIKGATVTLLPEPLPDPIEKLNDSSLRAANSDANGVVRFIGLTPGRYRAVALTGDDRQRNLDLNFLRDRINSNEAIVLDFGQTAIQDIFAK